MPIKMNACPQTISNNYRFDFGVPLEDISPPNDIHPRLKHLFNAAFNCYTLSDIHDMEHTLKFFQGSLEDCFNMKEELIFQVPCNMSDYQSPGSYFWLIRHFLGLLPIPLLPKYFHKFTYDWENLGKKCQMVLSHNKYDANSNYQVNNSIARYIDSLPTEHFLLLTTLVNFIRKIAFRFGVLHKHNFVCLAKYYCGSVFIRPYRPGHRDDRKVFPLFIYLLSKWNNIIKKCERHVTIPENSSRYMPSYQLKRNAYCQVNFINGNYDVFENSTNLSPLRTCCQTGSLNIPKQSCCTHKSCQTELTETTNTYCQTDINLDDSGSIVPLANSSVIDNHYYSSDRYFTALINDTSWNPDTSIHHDHEDSENNDVSNERDSMVNFHSMLDENEYTGWDDVMRETENTVKKVEEYIYDDYETFRWEDYNQISTEKKYMSTFKDNKKQPVWTDYTPRSLIYRESNDENESISVLISNKTYFKFPDICDDDLSKFSSSGASTALNTAREIHSLHSSKSCNHMNELLHPIEKKEKPEELRHEKSKINFSLKRFKMSFDFLRVLIPKKNYRTTYRASNVRYKKIVNYKASTL
ncbi:unnamed protein product [Phaedon cochleariae]|uniref:Uncharacterized protein n=1 Tax=Phaedon cochleariae TaxID=80249 RepID=A0A9P0GX66_PHACE|nr:unnamed protein product [Phaedon cochleariae]